MSSPDLIRFLSDRGDQILEQTLRHVQLVAVATLFAVAIGVPLGALLTRRARLARPILGLAKVMQTIPSLALFGFLIPLPLLGGIGARTAIIALVVYALLPILQGTYTGLKGVPDSVVEAGIGMGMTPRQLLWSVELPLALPVIMSGIRVATVICVGIATIAVILGLGACGGTGQAPIRIGSKNFTEQVILGELLAALIEHDTDLAVDRRLNLGGTFVCHKALVAGELDLYVEYTGTALSAILEQPPSPDSDRVYETVRSEYARRFDLTWMPPLGFSNTFALLVRPEDARAHVLKSIADLASVADTFRAGFGYEFLERADGYRGLAAAYGFELAMKPREMELGLLYRALTERQVDLVVGNSTDGLIDSLDLVMLADDRGYFPAYDAAPVIRAETLRAHPELEAVLRRLDGAISEEAMRRMNYAVTGRSRAPEAVAEEFLRESGLFGSRSIAHTDTMEIMNIDRESGFQGVAGTLVRLQEDASDGDARALRRLVHFLATADGYVSEGLDDILGDLFTQDPDFLLTNTLDIEESSRAVLYQTIIRHNYLDRAFQGTYPEEWDELKEMGPVAVPFMDTYESYLADPESLEQLREGC